MGRPDFSGKTFPYERIRGYTSADASSVAASGTDVLDVYAPAGYIAQLVSVYLNVAAPPGAASGSHLIYVGMSADSVLLTPLVLTSAYDGNLLLNTSEIKTATSSEAPADATAQLLAVESIVYDSERPMRIEYDNNSNVATVQARNISYIVRERQVV